MFIVQFLPLRYFSDLEELRLTKMHFRSLVK